MRRPTSHEIFDAREEGKGRGSAYGALARPVVSAAAASAVDSPMETRAVTEPVVSPPSLDRKLEF